MVFFTDLTGKKFNRLLVISATSQRSSRGEIVWLCRCDCGTEKRVVGGNLKYGSVQSCGCFRSELSSLRQQLSKKPLKICLVTGCENTIEKGGKGYCGKHYSRYRKYGNTDYVMPEDMRVMKQRLSLLEGIKLRKQNKPTTYSKYYGKHEHRQKGEIMAGRKLSRYEHVHHKNDNKHDNSLENLEVLTAEQHGKLHHPKGIDPRAASRLPKKSS